MTDEAKGQENLARLANRGNYRDAAARDMANVYSVILAHRLIFVSKFEQSAFLGNKSALSIADGPPVFSEEQFPGDTSLGTEFHGLKSANCALNILKKRGGRWRLKKGQQSLTGAIQGNCRIEGAGREERQRPVCYH